MTSRTHKSAVLIFFNLESIPGDVLNIASELLPNLGRILLIFLLRNCTRQVVVF